MAKNAVAAIRATVAGDSGPVFELYKRVAAEPGGLARLADDVDESYVADFLNASLSRGLSFVAELEGRIVGEVHGYSAGLFCFAHVLGELTIAVDPAAQGAGVGRALFERFMSTVREERPDLLRVELIVRESNERAIRFYESLGFTREGGFRNRIRNLDGSLEADIPMAWVRPG